MRIVAAVRCFIGRHEPNRRKVKWNGVTYVSHCRHCGMPIERHRHKDWRKTGETEVARQLKAKLLELPAEPEYKD